VREREKSKIDKNRLTYYNTIVDFAMEKLKP
jgi:hypothetical protein